jgi:hypothetical protein
MRVLRGYVRKGQKLPLGVLWIVSVEWVGVWSFGGDGGVGGQSFGECGLGVSVWRRWGYWGC